MKKTYKLIALSGFLLFTQNCLQAQTPVKTYDNTLRGQYQQMVDKSRYSQGYKVISQEKVAELWRSFNDSLAAQKRNVIAVKKELAASQQTVKDLQSNLTSKNADLAQTNAEANSISFLGMSIEKSSYSSIVWGIILAMALALAFIIFKSVGYKREASYRIKLFSDLSEEYQNHKIKANEKEKKLARELQDERNKLEELNLKNR